MLMLTLEPTLKSWHYRLLLIVCLIVRSGSWGVSAEPTQLPLNRVAIFSTGLGYFEHVGEVRGGTSVQLQFPLEDVKDVVKSLVVIDAAGHVSVDYDSQNPEDESLAKLQVNLRDNTTLTDLLTQLRGERVRIKSDAVVEGNVVSVETRRLPMGNELKDVELVNLKTDTGLRSVPLYQLEELSFLDETINEQFQRALELLSSMSGPQMRSVRVQFKDGPARQVRIGYLLSMPVWKTSYRVVLADDGKTLLQGWAHIENPTEQDWKDVNLSLVSSQPISFIMDLYGSIYVQRPAVAPPITVGMLPLAHSENLRGQRPFVIGIIPLVDGGLGGGGGFGGFGGGGGGGLGGGGFGGGGMGGGGGGVAGGAPAEAPSAAEGNYNFEDSATGVAVGETFRYDIDTLVTVPKQQSAMLPIFNGAVPAEKLSIYNRRANSTHPLHGLEITNDTGLHLVAGPMTVFEAGEYGGDAQVGHVRPEEKRLISYALDAETEIAATESSTAGRLVSAKIDRGDLQLKYANDSKIIYQAKNNSDEARTLLIEQPIKDGWSLVEPAEPTEEAEDVLRFRISIEPNKSNELTVTEVQFRDETKKLIAMSQDELLTAVRSEVLSEAVRKVLQTILDQQALLTDYVQQRAQASSKISDINKEQERIRKNLDTLDRNTELYRTYVKKLTDQELELEQLRVQLIEIDNQDVQTRKDLTESTSTLKAE